MNKTLLKIKLLSVRFFVGERFVLLVLPRENHVRLGSYRKVFGDRKVYCTAFPRLKLSISHVKYQYQGCQDTLLFCYLYKHISIKSKLLDTATFWASDCISEILLIQSF